MPCATNPDSETSRESVNLRAPHCFIYTPDLYIFKAHHAFGSSAYLAISRQCLCHSQARSPCEHANFQNCLGPCEPDQGLQKSSLQCTSTTLFLLVELCLFLNCKCGWSGGASFLHVMGCRQVTEVSCGKQHSTIVYFFVDTYISCQILLHSSV